MQPADVKPATPPVMLPYQQRWIADPAPVKIWPKSRRIGASWTDACDSVMTSARANEGMDTLYIGYSEDMTREYIDDCAMWANAFQYAAGQMQETLFDDIGPDGDVRQIKAFRIDFASGHKILALSSRPRSIRGKQGKVTIDEAAFHDDLDGLLTAALALLIWGGRVHIMSSHNGEDNPFNLLVKDVRAGKYDYSLHQTTFDDALRDGLYERVKLIQGKRFKFETREAWREHIYALYGDRAAEELDCIPKAGSGVYIPRTLVERCQSPDIKPLRLTRPPEFVLRPDRLEEMDRWCRDNLQPVIDSMAGRRTVVGRDFGRSGDLSITKVLQQDVAPGRWTVALHLEERNMPFDCQQFVFFYLVDRLPLFFHGKLDARGNGQQLAEAAMQRYGVSRIECVMASPTWYATYFPPYKAAFEDRSITTTHGEDEVADHRRVILDKGRPRMDDGRDKGSDGGFRHGDGAIAGVMGWAATMQEGEPAAGATVEAESDAYAPGPRGGMGSLSRRPRDFGIGQHATASIIGRRRVS